jgi:hypothetical protein
LAGFQAPHALLPEQRVTNHWHGDRLPVGAYRDVLNSTMRRICFGCMTAMQKSEQRQESKNVNQAELGAYTCNYGALQ